MRMLLLVVFVKFLICSNYNDDIYRAYIDGDMQKWQQILDKINKQQKQTDQEILDAINYHYGFVAWAISNNKLDLANKYFKIATIYLAKLEKKNYKLSYVYAYKAAFVGFEIALNKYKAPFIGLKSLEFANKSIELDTNNYFAYYQLGNIYRYMPSIWQDNKQKALFFYLKALQKGQLFNLSSAQNWNYLNLMISLAQIYEELNQHKKAIEVYNTILKIEPNIGWVKNVLLPQLLKKI